MNFHYYWLNYSFKNALYNGSTICLFFSQFVIIIQFYKILTSFNKKLLSGMKTSIRFIYFTLCLILINKSTALECFTGSNTNESSITDLVECPQSGSVSCSVSLKSFQLYKSRIKFIALFLFRQYTWHLTTK